MKIKDEFKKLIPPLTPDEFKQLETNCIAEGIREAILTWSGYIIDGHNRYEIATKNNLPYQSIEKDFESEEAVKEWMILNQFGRRNLSNYQRSVLALELEDMFSAKAKENMKKGGEVSQQGRLISAKAVDTKEELSKVAGVSRDTITKVKKIQKEAPQVIKDKLSSGEISINEAHKEVKIIERKQKIEKEREEMAEIGKSKKIEIDFRHGDFEEVFSDLEDGSIDCIITDPPYPRQFIECWTKLARFAKRVLKPHGYCIAYSGQMYLPEVMQRMSEHLDYYWTFAVYHEGQTQIVNGVNFICRWKPVLIYQNGRKKVNHTIQDYFISEHREKTGHDWQQSKSGVAYLVENFTKPGDKIMEPFAGSGTTLVVADQKGRIALGAEIDEQTFNIAKSNL